MAPPSQQCNDEADALKDRLRQILIEQARTGTLVTYSDLAGRLGPMPPQTIHQLTGLLEGLMAEDAEAGRPLLAALCVGRLRHNMPAPGFFMIAEALGLFDTPKSDWRKSVALEHVIGRKELIDALLKASSIDEVSAVLERGETCVVLRDQHKHLPKGQGWERYKNLRIVPGPLVREHQRRSGSPTSTNRTSEERVATILLPNSVARPIKEGDGLTPPPAKSH